MPTLLGETYKLNFPSLSSEQISRLVNKNPIYIYTELKRNNEFSRIASIIDKEGKNEKKDSLNDLITLLQKNLQKNIAPPQRRVAATSDMVFYRDALKEMDDVGEFLGVISHELGHVIDEVIKDPAIIEKITKKYNVIINAEDYAKWGEKELFADISTLNFYATLFDKEEDVQRRNRLIQTYARLRKLRKGLYMPFLKEPIIELGSSLKSAIVVRTLAEEYEHIANQKCDECGAEFDRSKLDRKSYVIYHRKPHDVLRCYCSLCNKSKDFFFDFIRTMMGSDEEKAETIEDWKKIHGEIKDPIPDDIFSMK